MFRTQAVRKALSLVLALIPAGMAQARELRLKNDTERLWFLKPSRSACRLGAPVPLPEISLVKDGQVSPQAIEFSRDGDSCIAVPAGAEVRFHFEETDSWPETKAEIQLKLWTTTWTCRIMSPRHGAPNPGQIEVCRARVRFHRATPGPQGTSAGRLSIAAPGSDWEKPLLEPEDESRAQSMDMTVKFERDPVPGAFTVQASQEDPGLWVLREPGPLCCVIL